MRRGWTHGDVEVSVSSGSCKVSVVQLYHPEIRIMCNWLSIWGIQTMSFSTFPHFFKEMSSYLHVSFEHVDVRLQ